VALPAAALAQTSVTATASLQPLPGRHGTGDVPGAGALLRIDYAIAGAEAAFPPPLASLDVSLPLGTRLSEEGLTQCSGPRIAREAESCPVGSRSGGHGRETVAGTHLAEQLREEGIDQAYVGSGDRLYLLSLDPDPFATRTLAAGTPAAGGLLGGPQIDFTLPAVETAPGAPDLAFEALDLSLGAWSVTSRGRKRRAHYLIRLPRRCSRGSWHVDSTLTFQNGEAVTVADTLPCPRTPARHGAKKRHR